jgi:hypothetical protein
MKSIRFSFVFITAFVAVFALTACRQQPQTQVQVPGSANIFSMGGPGEAIALPGIASSTPPQFQPDFAGAGILAAADNNLNLLQKINDTRNYDTIVLLAPTAHLTKENKIFTYENEGVLKEKGVTFDDDLLQKIIASKTSATLGEVPAASAWNNTQTASLAAKFTNAKFALISVSAKASENEINNLAAILAQNLTEKSLVLAIANFEKNDDENLNQFFAQFENTVIMQCDSGKFDELPDQNTKALEVLARFIGQKNSCTFLAKDWSGTTLQALYGFNGGAAANSPAMANAPAPFTAPASDTAPAALTSSASPVYFTALGDVMLGRFVRTLMDANGLNYPFRKMNPDFLKTNDFLLANLEGPIAKNAIKTSKSIAFRFMPDVAGLLKENYFDVIDLANNHAYDMGAQGYADTKDILTATGLIHFGDTKGINENSVAKMKVRGQKIAFLGLEEVTGKIDDAKAVETIKNLAAEGYKVIAVPHWGVEYTHKPNDRQKELAHKFIDAGAAMVIGHHPHVVQAFENYNGRPIFYSLGNAVFDQYFSPDTQEGLAISAAMSANSIEIFLVPLKIRRSQLMLMDEDERKKFLERFAGYGSYDETLKQEILDGRLLLQSP